MIDLDSHNVVELLSRAAARTPNRAALVVEPSPGVDEKITFGELWDRADRASCGLKKLGIAAERAWQQEKAAGTPRPAATWRGNCDVDVDLPPVTPPPPREPRFSDWVLTGVAFGEAAMLAYTKLRGRATKIRG